MREALLTAIFARMQSYPDDPFVAAVINNYAAWEGIQGGPYPTAVSYIVSESDSGIIGEQHSEFEWQMNIYSINISEVNRLGQLCRNFFDNVRLCSGPFTFSCIYEATFGPMRDNAAEPFQITITFTSTI